jgi:hypothetical protein
MSKTGKDRNFKMIQPTKNYEITKKKLKTT